MPLIPLLGPATPAKDFAAASAAGKIASVTSAVLLLLPRKKLRLFLLRQELLLLRLSTTSTIMPKARTAHVERTQSRQEHNPGLVRLASNAHNPRLIEDERTRCKSSLATKIMFLNVI